MAVKTRVRDLRPEGDPLDVVRINAAGDELEFAPPDASGATQLSDLTDVDLTGIATGDMLQWDGTNWVNVDAPSGGGGATTLDGLTDVDLTGASDGQYLKRVSGIWVPATAPGGGGSGPTWVRSSLDGTALAGSTSWATADSSKDLSLTGLTAGDVVRCKICNLDISASSFSYIYQDDFSGAATANNALTAPEIGSAYTYLAGNWKLDGSGNAVDVLAGGDHAFTTNVGQTTYSFFSEIEQLGSDCAVLVRVLNSSNWMMYHLNTSKIYTQTAGAYDSPAVTPVAPTWVAGDICRIDVTPTDVTVYRSTDGGANYTLIGTKASTSFNTSSSAGFRGNGSTTIFKVRQAWATMPASLSAVDLLLLDLVTRPSSSNVNSVFASAAAPSGSSGSGAMTFPATRSNGHLEVDYTVQSGDLSSGAMALRLLYRTPTNLGRTLTRARLMAAKL